MCVVGGVVVWMVWELVGLVVSVCVFGELVFCCGVLLLWCGVWVGVVWFCQALCFVGLWV